MRITRKMIEAAYSYAKNVYDEKINKENAIDSLEKEFGMNRGSAADYVNNFQHMLNGKKYTRTMNNEGTEYYLTKIRSDYSTKKLSNALTSIDQHITYYEGLKHGKLNGIREIHNKYKKLLEKNDLNIFPEVIENGDSLFEGAKRTVIVNSYERNPKARNECIEHHGVLCSVCGFDFKEKYGDIGAGFIHVHHLTQLSNIGKGYKVDPIKDLRTVCPNCHSMLHRKNPPYSIEELKSFIKIT